MADPRTGDFYLAESANRQITRIDPRTSKISAIGTGNFSVIANCHTGDFDGMGPNGLEIVGNQIYASNGDSMVHGFSLRSDKQTAEFNTGAACRPTR